HDRYFLDRVTEHTFELYHGTIDTYPGNFSAYWQLKSERLEVQRRTYDKQQIEIAKNEDFIRRNAYGQKATQAKDREKKLARIERVTVPREIAAPTMGFPPVKRSGDIVLRAEQLSKAFDRPLFSNLSFQIDRGERWGIVGPNGTGKTTLLRCLLGLIEPSDGRVSFGAGVKPAYFDQLLSGLDDEEQVVDAIRPPGKEMNEPQRRDLLARFGLTGDVVFQKIKSLSGGERNRAALARLAGTDANLLILDEPTNHLDLWARDSLEQSLRAFEGTVLFVSHDRYFLNQVADHLLIVEPTRFRTLEGNYDNYLHFVKKGLAADHNVNRIKAGTTDSTGASIASAENGKNDERRGTAPKLKRRFPYRKVADLEVDIAKCEARITELHDLLGDSAVLRNGDRARELKLELTSQQERLAQLYEHWEEAAELNN
ncbi:MAG: ABC-F family ATP-binding cassette domain-containing protein, partial [Planctomycetota bacterium]|nr:ABC-F family ATP-binding cassette domain-containing protein [Planctomycetota bacterium]